MAAKKKEKDKKPGLIRNVLMGTAVMATLGGVVWAGISAFGGWFLLGAALGLWAWKILGEKTFAKALVWTGTWIPVAISCLFLLMAVGGAGYGLYKLAALYF